MNKLETKQGSGRKLYKQIKLLGFGRHDASLSIRCENAKIRMSLGARFSSPLKNGLSPVLMSV